MGLRELMGEFAVEGFPLRTRGLLWICEPGKEQGKGCSDPVQRLWFYRAMDLGALLVLALLLCSAMSTPEPRVLNYLPSPRSGGVSQTEWKAFSVAGQEFVLWVDRVNWQCH